MNDGFPAQVEKGASQPHVMIDGFPAQVVYKELPTPL